MKHQRLWLDLTRHFFQRLFDTELVSEPGQLQRLVVGIFAALASLSMLAPVSLYRKYAELPRLLSSAEFQRMVEADRLGYVTFAMLVVAFVTVLQWQALFPSDRDYQVLMPLPVPRAVMFLAKFSAVALFAAIFLAGVGLAPALLLPMVQENRWAGRETGIGDILSHGGAIVSSSAFAFASLVALQGFLINLLGSRIFSRISWLVQAFLLLVLLCVLPQVLSVPVFYRRGLLPDWFPPRWFLGGPAEGWWTAAMAVAAAAGLYSLGYFRHSAFQLESGRPATRRFWESPFRVLFRRMAVGEYAIASFILKTFARSRKHKLLMAGYLGIGLAVLVNMLVMIEVFDPLVRPAAARQEGRIEFALSAPLVVAFFVISGIRVVFSIPAALEANWIFRMLETPAARVRWRYASETVYHLAAIAPAVLIAFPCVGPLLGWRTAALHGVFCALLCGLLVDLMLWEWRKVPFLCAYLPGKTNVATTFVLYWILFGFFALSTTSLESWCLRQAPRMLVMGGLLLALAAAVRNVRLKREGGALDFEDRIAPPVADLGLVSNS